jgi:hypothetical protein
MFSKRRIILLLLGAIVFGSFFTTEDLRPFSAQAGTSTEAQARAAIERLRERTTGAPEQSPPPRTDMRKPEREENALLPMMGPFCRSLSDLAETMLQMHRAGLTFPMLRQLLFVTGESPLLHAGELILSHMAQVIPTWSPRRFAVHIQTDCLRYPSLWAGTIHY